MTVNESGRVPTAEEEERFWELVEAAWASSGAEVARARRALANRAPGAGSQEPLAVVEGALEAFLEELTARNRGSSSEELTALDRVVERKLHEIDRADVHAVTGGSDDGFLYARGFIVAMGRDFYDAVVREPKTAPAADCGKMCYFFARLHDERFGGHPDTGSKISRESCSNPAGWSS